MNGFMGRDRSYVIAEIGSNHGGSLDAAMGLIDAAADAGADAAKFQAGHADHVYDPAQFPKEHRAFKKYVEPSLGWLAELAGRCEQRGIDFGCSTFCLDALDAVDPFVRWHKIASIEATWDKFVRAVKAKGKPVIISTGGLEAGQAKALRGPNTVVMQCVLAYPASLDDCDLLAWPHAEATWGLSDHTVHPTIAPCAAVALGALVVEKHFRLGGPDSIGMQAYGNSSAPFTWFMPGRGTVQVIGRFGWKTTSIDSTTFPQEIRCDERPPDWDHSLWPAAFREMVHAIRLTEQALGSSKKRIRDNEQPMLKYRRGPKGLRGA